MSKLIKLSALVLLLVSTLVSSCTKTENHYYTVENVTVSLNSKELLETVVKPFKASTRMSTTSSTTEYEHKFPNSYKAYFVSKETRGEYKTAQVVKIIDVTAGQNTITIPKLDYEVYVTNYVRNDSTENKPYAWYKTTGITALPAHSDELYLFGSADINYTELTEGTVELTNPYAAVMIRNNQWIDTPTYNYGSNPSYSLIPDQSWYLLYIKGNNTQTTIPVNIPGYNSNNFQLSRSIEPNKEYRFTIDGSIENIENDGFFVDVKPIEKEKEETIKL